jgi:hypothetical protein
LCYFVGGSNRHSIYGVCLRLLQLSDTAANVFSTDEKFKDNLKLFRETCVKCCSDCIDVFDEFFYTVTSPIAEEESKFAAGYLMRLVHILRNINLAKTAGRPQLYEVFTSCDCVHLKLLFQNIVLTMSNLDQGDRLDAKTILAIAANWFTMRQILIYSTHSKFAYIDRLLHKMDL